MKIGRNDPCPCGSGKKYKKCCLKGQIPKEIKTIFETQSHPEPHLHLVNSVIWKNHRVRVIWNRVHFCPVSESFHEFLLRMLVMTLGNKWFESQCKLCGGKRHILVRWFSSYHDWKKNAQTEASRINDHSWGAMPTGSVMALHSFAYDMYCLQIVNELPKYLIRRLRNMNEFQGARYEVAVAAIVARAGFDITFLDKKIRHQRHCEFIAKNKDSGEEIGVEAKSRRRKGVVHEKGEIDYSAIVKGDVRNLFMDACSQAPDNIPYFIFIDLNVLPTPGITIEDKPWFNDIRLMMKECREPSSENPDIFNVVAFTNFGHYYEGDTSIVLSEDYLQVRSLFPRNKITNPMMLEEIERSLGRYYRIPEQV